MASNLYMDRLLKMGLVENRVRAGPHVSRKNSTLSDSMGLGSCRCSLFKKHSLLAKAHHVSFYKGPILKSRLADRTKSIDKPVWSPDKQ